MKRTISMTLALMITVLTCFSCGGTSAPVSDSTTAPDAGTDAAVTAEADPFEGINLGGFNMRVLNWEGKLYDTQSVLDYDEQTGDSVDDAIFLRNRFVEEKINMTLDVIYPTSGDCQQDFAKMMAAGEDAYDAVFNRTSSISSNIASGYLYNLYTLDDIDIDQPWWYPSFNKSLILEGDKLYQAATPAHLMSFEMTVACYVNKDILDRGNVDAPYDIVRSGKWTYDEMFNYMKQFINTNGDDSFSETGNSTFGVATFGGWIGILSGNADGLVKLDKDGKPYFAGASEKFFNFVDKATSVFVGDGYHCGDATTYAPLFCEGRALFSLISIGNANIFRDMDDEYGILPAPKYSESEDYRSPMGNSLLLCIPSISNTAEETATAFNVLSYYSYRDVFPVYYKSLCYKGLRDDDSIDMLEIISDSRWADIGCVYGWTYSALSSMGTSLLEGNLNAASYIESIRNSVENTINKAMNY